MDRRDSARRSVVANLWLVCIYCHGLDYRSEVLLFQFTCLLITRSALVNFFYLPGAIFGSFTSDWMGPRRALMTFVVAQGVVGKNPLGITHIVSEVMAHMKFSVS